MSNAGSSWARHPALSGYIHALPNCTLAAWRDTSPACAPVLRPGARLAYVVGDQASYLRIMIRTGQILADLAQSLGYRVMGVDLFRTRHSTVTGDQLREEVVLLEWPGN